MFSNSKIAYLSTLCLEWYINMRAEDAIFPIMVRQIDT